VTSSIIVIFSSSARYLSFNTGPENIFPDRHVTVGSGFGMFGSPWEPRVGGASLAIRFVFVVLMKDITIPQKELN
jgi:hypothetical protein